MQDINIGASYRIYRNAFISTYQQHEIFSSRSVHKCSTPPPQPLRPPQWPPRRERTTIPAKPNTSLPASSSSATNTSNIRQRAGRVGTPEFLRRKKKDTLRVPQLRTSQPPPTLLPRVIGGAAFCRLQSLMSYRRQGKEAVAAIWRTEGWLRWPGWEAGKMCVVHASRGLS